MKYSDNPGTSVNQQRSSELETCKRSESICIKCKRNIQSKAVFCDKGNHWIHYHCERSSKADIESIEKTSSNETYCCKVCKAESVKVPQISISDSEQHIINQDGKILMPQNPHYSSPEKILEDEIYINCAVCDAIVRGTIENCTQSDIECHLKCVRTNSVGERICFCCSGMEEQLDKEGENTITTQDCDEQICPEIETQTENQISLTLNTFTASGQRNSQKCSPLKTKETGASNENVKIKEIKQTELRQKEQKLRKGEEDLKMREKIIEEHDSERVWFKTHIQKLEMKVNELEKSNSILRVQANAQSEYPNNNSGDNKLGQTESLVQRIQERVTNMVLRQVEAQFEKIEKLMNNQIPENEQNNNDSSSLTNKHRITIV